MTPFSSVKINTVSSSYFLDAHHCLVIESIFTALAFIGLAGYVSFPVQILLSWDTFAITGIILSWVTLLTQNPYELKRRLRLKERTRHFLFFIVIFAAVASFVATWLLLSSVRSSGHQLNGIIALAILTPALSWFLVHTRFALQYAHFYYAGFLEKLEPNVSKGLLFPGKGEYPDYLDFAYFSFVIGMTCQVSDVQITRKGLRLLALLHGLISFAFNTTILALVINIVAGIF
ncbi:MAG: DUF1345 domain-containing protein [Chthoniobacterales bacterium]|nr:DUF1345 domain-containing protein [Chthoniobacterales bacterium]